MTLIWKEVYYLANYFISLEKFCPPQNNKKKLEKKKTNKPKKKTTERTSEQNKVIAKTLSLNSPQHWKFYGLSPAMIFSRQTALHVKLHFSVVILCTEF